MLVCTPFTGRYMPETGGRNTARSDKRDGWQCALRRSKREEDWHELVFPERLDAWVAPRRFDFSDVDQVYRACA